MFNVIPLPSTVNPPELTVLKPLLHEEEVFFTVTVDPDLK